MSRKKRGLVRGREIMLSPPFIVHLLFNIFFLYIFSLDLIHGFD